MRSEEGQVDPVNGRRQAMKKILLTGASAGLLGATNTRAAQSTANSSIPGAVTIATDMDYQQDPDRWGTAEVAALFPGFEHMDVRTSGAIIRLRHGGSGPPLLLLHGNPENHVTWHKVAARLSKHYHVILPDLRGYGDSSLPDAGPDNINFSFRAMATDMVEVMKQLGYEKFFLAGHDRGGRTAHRLALDHPQSVTRIALLDVVPNYYVWTHPTKDWVIGTWHWGFMAQPEPFPERMIGAVPAEWFLKSRMALRGHTGLDFLTPVAFAEYVRCFTPKMIAASCRDYRACATVGFEHDTADKDRKIDMPALILWGARGQSPQRAREFIEIWNGFASDIRVSEGLQCGHYIQEELPDVIFDRFTKFFV
jgi:haloacetate dehalogenase